MANNIIVSGLNETINMLDSLSKGADQLTRQASTEAANDLRDTWLIGEISGGTGIGRGVIRKNARITRASVKWPGAKIYFSSAGIPVEEYRYSRKGAGANAARSQILVDWITGGQKVAAGFINQFGKRQMPLSTRNEKRKGGKTYTYNKEEYGQEQMTAAMGPSLATAYLDLPENEVQNQAQVRLNDRLAYLLDEALK
jgi:hypothetical protein